MLLFFYLREIGEGRSRGRGRIRGGRIRTRGGRRGTRGQVRTRGGRASRGRQRGNVRESPETERCVQLRFKLSSCLPIGFICHV